MLALSYIIHILLYMNTRYIYIYIKNIYINNHTTTSEYMTAHDDGTPRLLNLTVLNLTSSWSDLANALPILPTPPKVLHLMFVP